VDGYEPGSDNLDLFYRLARLLEDTDDDPSRQEAHKLYESIVAVQLTYRDARRRRDALAAGKSEKPTIKR